MSHGRDGDTQSPLSQVSSDPGAWNDSAALAMFGVAAVSAWALLCLIRCAIHCCMAEGYDLHRRKHVARDRDLSDKMWPREKNEIAHTMSALAHGVGDAPRRALQISLSSESPYRPAGRKARMRHQLPHSQERRSAQWTGAAAAAAGASPQQLARAVELLERNLGGARPPAPPRADRRSRAPQSRSFQPLDDEVAEPPRNAMFRAPKSGRFE